MSVLWLVPITVSKVVDDDDDDDDDDDATATANADRRLAYHLWLGVTRPDDVYIIHRVYSMRPYFTLHSDWAWVRQRPITTTTNKANRLNSYEEETLFFSSLLVFLTMPGPIGPIGPISSCIPFSSSWSAGMPIAFQPITHCSPLLVPAGTAQPISCPSFYRLGARAAKKECYWTLSQHFSIAIRLRPSIGLLYVCKPFKLNILSGPSKTVLSGSLHHNVGRRPAGVHRKSLFYLSIFTTDHPSTDVATSMPLIG